MGDNSVKRKARWADLPEDHIPGQGATDGGVRVAAGAQVSQPSRLDAAHDFTDCQAVWARLCQHLWPCTANSCAY